MSYSKLPVIALSTILFVGCNPVIKVETPEKPITVNLNLNVEHKLTVRMKDELDRLIKKNPDNFKKFKENPHVCEGTEGFAKALPGTPEAIRKQVDEMNAQRLELYQQFEEHNKAAPGSAGKAAALKLRTAHTSCSTKATEEPDN